ncbi:MAG: PAS domain S-box protein [Planctomycetes bacterium]|nr:PAS domain S-box protein [Planctomycetota bacterium]
MGSQRDPDADSTAGSDQPSAEVAGTLAQRYRLLFEHSLAGVYCTTLTGEIVDCNESLATMLGYDSRADLLSHRATELYFGTADRQAFLTRLHRTGVLTNSELRLRRKDGTPIDILENVVLLSDEEGRPRIIQGTMVDISERKRAEQALRTSEQRYRELTGDLRRVMQRLQSVREEEQARIARELHDELGQGLTALNMDVHWLRARVAPDSEEKRTRLESMAQLLKTTMQAVRRICSNLRPVVLDDFGLLAAIEWQASEIQTRTGIQVALTLPSEVPVIPSDQATAVFRILQEALTNVARHARATTAALHVTVQGDTLRLVLTDNGVGIADAQLHGKNSIGLFGMRERALRWGGNVEIERDGGGGTRVTLTMPVEPEP